MNRSDRVCFCFLLIVIARVASAAAPVLECPTSPAVSIEGISRTVCEVSRSVMIERYLSPEPTSVYASNLDRREVAIATGKNAESVASVAGLRLGPRAVQVQTKLLQPPFVDQIARRYVNPMKIRYKNWMIAYEEIEYGAQGSAHGFPFECATAIQSTWQARKIVAECFPLEERARFAKTLDAVR